MSSLKWKVTKSSIHGNGVFARVDIQPKEDIGVAFPLILETPDHRVFERNVFGLLINHSNEPNAECIKIGENWHFIATQPIVANEEIVTDYKDYEKKIDQESFTTRKKVSVI